MIYFLAGIALLCAIAVVVLEAIKMMMWAGWL